VTRRHGQTQQRQLKAAEVTWRNKTWHASQNIGKTEVQVLAVELKMPLEDLKLKQVGFGLRRGRGRLVDLIRHPDKISLDKPLITRYITLVEKCVWEAGDSSRFLCFWAPFAGFRAPR
jgi:hypothetical protein